VEAAKLVLEYLKTFLMLPVIGGALVLVFFLRFREPRL